MINILLCGGSGTRLWPISRKLAPKQFNPLFENQSLFQKTVIRNNQVCDSFRIVAGEDQYFLAMDQIAELSESISTDYILEPMGRNTAPAIALALKDLDPNEIVLVTPTDHLINNLENYKQVVYRASELASEGYLVTFGIKPTHAETGYGYIHFSGEDVKEFVEKPNEALAKKYLESGEYLWNSGMFCFKAGAFLDELKSYREDIYNACQLSFKTSDKINRIDHEKMAAIPAESIDYAVMEKSKKVKVIASDINWSDVGSFDSLYENLETDSQGNTIAENHINLDSKNNFVRTNDKLIATVDVEDLVIVDTDDALLISKRGSTQKIKDVVEKVKEINSELTQIHTKGFRPWGSYKVLHEDVGYKVKRIIVKPNSRLSLQKHKHRNEHWVVVKGTVTVTNGDKTFDLLENQSTYIPAGELHRLENKTDQEVIIIEAQVGSYVGEDDIERIQDDYQRD